MKKVKVPTFDIPCFPSLSWWQDYLSIKNIGGTRKTDRHQVLLSPIFDNIVVLLKMVYLWLKHYITFFGKIVFFIAHCRPQHWSIQHSGLVWWVHLKMAASIGTKISKLGLFDSALMAFRKFLWNRDNDFSVQNILTREIIYFGYNFVNKVFRNATEFIPFFGS